MKELFCSMFAFMSLATCQGDAVLNGNEYVLIKPEYKTEITLGFKKNRFYGKVLNNYFGTYKIDGDKIDFGNVASTLMAGPNDVMEEEGKYLRTLDGKKTYTIKGNNLILKSQDGSETVYKKQ